MIENHSDKMEDHYTNGSLTSTESNSDNNPVLHRYQIHCMTAFFLDTASEHNNKKNNQNTIGNKTVSISMKP